jgi:methylated-DNA-[protein]-cysteine S-methyltransferase
VTQSSPARSRAAGRPAPPLVWTSHATTLGRIDSGWTDQGLYRLRWDVASSLAEEPAAEVWSPEIAEFDRQLQRFFRAEPAAFRDVRIDATGWTPFFAEVYRVCRAIPLGETRRYADLASATGRPRAVRAVGQAMARNRIPLVIPCHRVVASDGQLRGFSAPGGLHTKRRLLDLEQRSE